MGVFMTLVRVSQCRGTAWLELVAGYHRCRSQAPARFSQQRNGVIAER